MNAAEIRTKLTAEPFQPLIIHVNDGRQFSIRHPEFVGINSDSPTVVVYLEDGGSEELDLMLISEIEVVQ